MNRSQDRRKLSCELASEKPYSVNYLHPLSAAILEELALSGAGVPLQRRSLHKVWPSGIL